ncbi:MAG TPA: YlxM family DNA-binding protein [Candidatus Evtepia faecigallinarum]|nr:YlxM family DNA-binding protein [Candidatus Evtepia faecigallinarum]
MKNQAYRMAMLYDFYGDLLTPRQKEFYDLYYNDDLSLAEIAENYGITRQGVRDIIVRAEKALEDIEEKTGLIQRYHRTRSAVAALHQQKARLEELNQTRFGDQELAEIAAQLQEAIDQLERE